MSLVHARINARAAEQRRRNGELRWYRSTPALAIELAKQAAMPSLARVGLAVKYGSMSGFNPAHDGWRWIEQASKAGLRVVLVNDVKDSGIKHRGWYTTPDNWSGETIQGAIIRLPARKGLNRYLLGYTDECNDDCYRVENELHEATPVDSGEQENMRELCRAADGLAERAAEMNRDYQEASDNLLRAKEAMSEAAETVRDAIAHYRRSLRLAAAISVPSSDACEVIDECQLELAAAREAYGEARDAAMDALRNAKHHGIGWRDV